LLVHTFFLCIGLTYLSLFLSDLLISSLLSYISALVFKLGHNLSNIPRSILVKQNFPLILLLQCTKLSDLQILPLFFLAQSFHRSSRMLHTRETDLHTELSQFQVESLHKASSSSVPTITVSVPATEPFVGTGVDPGFNTTTTHQQNPNYRPFRQHLRSR
jgi:hypothetical protein